jgi:hypothetical protein
MPTGVELDIYLPDIFIKQALLSPDPLWKASSGQGGGWTDASYAKAVAGSAVLVAACPGRITAQEGVARPIVSPYIKWDGREDDQGAVSAYLHEQADIRKVYVATVRRVDIFMGGSGSINQARSTYQALCKCLTGVRKSPITAQAGVLGFVASITAKATSTRTPRPW